MVDPLEDANSVASELPEHFSNAITKDRMTMNKLGITPGQFNLSLDSKNENHDSLSIKIVEMMEVFKKKLLEKLRDKEDSD